MATSGKEKKSLSKSQIEKLLRVLKEQNTPLRAGVLAKSINLPSAKNVNAALVKLQEEGKITEVIVSNIPMWKYGGVPQPILSQQQQSELPPLHSEESCSMGVPPHIAATRHQVVQPAEQKHQLQSQALPLASNGTSMSDLPGSAYSIQSVQPVQVMNNTSNPMMPQYPYDMGLQDASLLQDGGAPSLMRNDPMTAGNNGSVTGGNVTPGVDTSSLSGNMASNVMVNLGSANNVFDLNMAMNAINNPAYCMPLNNTGLDVTSSTSFRCAVTNSTYVPAVSSINNANASYMFGTHSTTPYMAMVSTASEPPSAPQFVGAGDSGKSHSQAYSQNQPPTVFGGGQNYNQRQHFNHNPSYNHHHNHSHNHQGVNFGQLSQQPQNHGSANTFNPSHNSPFNPTAAAPHSGSYNPNTYHPGLQAEIMQLFKDKYRDMYVKTSEVVLKVKPARWTDVEGCLGALEKRGLIEQVGAHSSDALWRSVESAWVANNSLDTRTMHHNKGSGEGMFPSSTFQPPNYRSFPNPVYRPQTFSGTPVLGRQGSRGGRFNKWQDFGAGGARGQTSNGAGSSLPTHNLSTAFASLGLQSQRGRGSYRGGRGHSKRTSQPPSGLRQMNSTSSTSNNVNTTSNTQTTSTTSSQSGTAAPKSTANTSVQSTAGSKTSGEQPISESAEGKMTERHKQLLELHRQDLSSGLVLDDSFLSALTKATVLTEDHCKQIKAQKSRALRIDTFLKVLPQQEDAVFESLRKVLYECNQPWLAEQLLFDAV